MASGVFITRISGFRNATASTVSIAAMPVSSSKVPAMAFFSRRTSCAPKDWVITSAKPLFSPQARLTIRL